MNSPGDAVNFCFVHGKIITAIIGGGAWALLSDGSESKLNAAEMEEEKEEPLRMLRPYLWRGE